MHDTNFTAKFRTCLVVCRLPVQITLTLSGFSSCTLISVRFFSCQEYQFPGHGFYGIATSPERSQLILYLFDRIFAGGFSEGCRCGPRFEITLEISEGPCCSHGEFWCRDGFEGEGECAVAVLDMTDLGFPPCSEYIAIQFFDYAVNPMIDIGKMVCPERNDPVWLEHPENLAVELFMVEPVCGLCYRNQVERVVLCAAGFCRGVFIVDIWMTEGMFQLSGAGICCQDTFEIRCESFCRLPASGCAVSCGIVVCCKRSKKAEQFIRIIRPVCTVNR